MPVVVEEQAALLGELQVVHQKRTSYVSPRGSSVEGAVLASSSEGS